MDSLLLLANMEGNNCCCHYTKNLIKQSLCFHWMLVWTAVLWIGSYSTCTASFEAAFQGSCTEKNPCEQTCFDLHDGTFECGCHLGYVLSQDGYSCKVAFNSSGEDEEDDDEDEEDVNGVSSSLSINSVGSHKNWLRFSAAAFAEHQVVDGRKTNPLKSLSQTRDGDVRQGKNEVDSRNDFDIDSFRDADGDEAGDYEDEGQEEEEEEVDQQYSDETILNGEEDDEGFSSLNRVDDGLLILSDVQRQPAEKLTMQTTMETLWATSGTTSSSPPVVEASTSTLHNSPQRPERETLQVLCERFQCAGESVCDSDGNGAVRCLCPLGRGGTHCEKSVEVRFPKFGGRSHLEISPLRNAYKDLQFTLEFRPERNSGLLLYSGEQRDGYGDFVSLAVIDEHLEFRFDCGSGVGLVVSKEKVLKHSWNKVTIFRHRWDAWMQLNDGEQVQGRSRGLFSRITFKENLFLGGVSNAPALSTKVATEDGFTGCIRYLEVNGHIYDFRPAPKGDAINGRGIGECSAEVCNNVECKNGGKCIANSADSALCLCPLGFAGDYCGTVVDLVMPSFNGTSYLKYPGLGSSVLSFLELLISFKPVDPDGLIFYNGFKSDGSGDFISLALSGGFVELRFDLGTGPAVVRSPEPVSLHEWHTAFVSRTARQGVLEVDNQPHVEGMSTGAFTQLSLPLNLYVGGVPSFDIISHQVGIKSSFRGCIQKVEINDKQLKLFEAALVGVNVDNCNHPCVNRPCLNHGLCSPRKDYFTCHCLLGYADSRCQTEIRDNITFPMFMGNSFLRYIRPEIIKRIVGSKFDIKFRFKTMSSDGLLLWTGHREMTASSDFVAVALQSGYIHLRFNLGSGEAFVLDNVTRVDDGQWHAVTTFRVQEKATLIVDDGPPVSGKSPGPLMQVNTDTGLYIGGVPDPLHLTIGKYSTGFVGCISELYLNRDYGVHLVSDAQGGLNIEACV